MGQLATPSGTIGVLRKHGLHLKRYRGQNFLVDPRVLARIVAAAALKEEDVVLEIGPGIGTLTRELALRAGRVVAVELEKTFLPALAETLAGLPQVEVIWGDALRVNFYTLLGGKPYKIVASLPYYLTSPFLGKVLENGYCPELMVLLVQAEVAARLTALPGSKAYGALSLLVQYYTRPFYLGKVSRAAFLPRPQVDSALVKLEVLPEPAVKVRDQELLFGLIRKSFEQRRKTLSNSLQPVVPELSKEELAQVLLTAGVHPTCRGEELSLFAFAAVADALFTYLQRRGNRGIY